MSLDLDRDISINGHEFKAGKDVNTTVTDTVDGKVKQVDYADGIKEVLKSAKGAEAVSAPVKETK